MRGTATLTSCDIRYSQAEAIYRLAYESYVLFCAQNLLNGIQANLRGKPRKTYNEHGSMSSMPHLQAMDWDFAERLSHITRGTTEAYYNYDESGQRTRKVVEKNNVVEERLYLGGFEIWRKKVNGNIDTERETLHIMDGFEDSEPEENESEKNKEVEEIGSNVKRAMNNKRRVAIVETKTWENGTQIANPISVQRYQLSNNIESATLELDDVANIISYEEYYPYGDTSYQAGRSASEVSQKRYRYTGKEKDEESGLYYYGARYYSTMVGIFISVDPKFEKYLNVSSYAYCLNNPINRIDPNGREPIKPYAGTVFGFVKFMNNLPTGIGKTTGSDAHAAMLRMGKIELTKNGPKPAKTAPFNKSDGNRYIYTKKGGWIDMTHFMFYAGRAYDYKIQKQEAQKLVNENSFAYLNPETQFLFLKRANMNPIGKAIQDGYMQERADKFTAQHSAYSYEDLPSNKFGAEFGANYFDPNSKLTFSEQIQDYLNNVLGATNPENAPNYNSLPNDYPTDKPSIQNKNTRSLFTIE